VHSSKRQRGASPKRRTTSRTRARAAGDRQPTILLCGSALDTIVALESALARSGVRLPGRTGGNDAAGGDAASRQWMTRRWKAAARVDAVVLCPALPAAARRERSAAEWLACIDASLKPTFFLAKHALLRLARGRGGTLVVLIPAPGGDALRRVAEDGMRALIEGLVRAAPRRVRVAALTGAPPLGQGAARGRRSAALARAVLALVERDADAPVLCAFERPSA
jgi:hypothetical protein